MTNRNKRKRNCGFLLAVFLFVLYCGHNDAKDAKPILEEFKNNYSSIMEACKAVGFVRDICSTRDQRKVAFTAAVKSVSSSLNSRTLIFEVVVSNVGNGYNPKTGIFTVPMDGMYVFYVAAVEYNKQYLQLDIVINNVPKVRLLGHHSASFQTGTNMVIQYLRSGDNVRVLHSQGKGYNTEVIPLTTFTGFKI